MNGINAVKAMQDYIKEHIKDEEFSANMVSAAAGYSKRHANRLFKQYIGITLQEYINSVYLTESANELTNTKNSILEIALNSNYKSHEGFTRSFKKRFKVTPTYYRESHIPIPLFVQYPINHYYALLKNKE